MAQLKKFKKKFYTKKWYIFLSVRTRDFIFVFFICYMYEN